jgi:beta-glucanase (GH16 family)
MRNNRVLQFSENKNYMFLLALANFFMLFSCSGSNNSEDGTVTVLISNTSTEFHIYSIDWSAASIKFVVDNQLFYTLSNAASFPFNQIFFLILNSAIGGNFGGLIDPNFTSSTFEIDYVRVYN